MEAKTNRILFSRFFNCYDTDSQLHSGFFQNFDFSETYSDLDVLTDVVGSLLDAYLYNEYSKRYVISTWAKYMHWDKTNKRYNIDLDFYDDFVKAFCAHILTAENFYQLTKFDWDTCIKVIEKTKNFGEHAKTRERGNDTTTMSDRQDTHHQDYAKQKTVTDNDIAQHRTVDNNSYAAQESDITTENDKAAFNTTVGTYVNDTKTRVYGDDVKARIDTLTTTSDAYKDTITATTDAHHDTMTDNIGAQTKTDTHGNITDRDFEHEDTETITETDHYDNEKLFQIQKELAALNVYKIVGDAVAATMLTLEWGW